MQLGVPLGVGGECWTCDPRVSGSSPGAGNLKKLLIGVGKFMVEKSGVEKSGVRNFMVEKSGVERSGVEAWG